MKFLLYALIACSSLLVACSTNNVIDPDPKQRSIEIVRAVKIITTVNVTDPINIPIIIRNTSNKTIKIKPTVRFVSIRQGHSLGLRMGKNTGGKDYEKVNRDHTWGNADNAIVLEAGESSNANSLAFMLFPNQFYGKTVVRLSLENYDNPYDKQTLVIIINVKQPIMKTGKDS